MDPIANTETQEQNPAVENNEELEAEKQNPQSQEEEKDTSNPDNKDEDTKEEVPEQYSSAKDSSEGYLDTETLVQEVATLKANIETKKTQAPDVKQFYKDIENYLSEDELQLKFEDDPSLYIDAVEKAKEEFLKENTADTKEDEDKLTEVEQRLHTARSVEEVLKDESYRDFNFKKMADFYQNDLTKKEQIALDKGSTKENLVDYFKKIYDEYYKRNPKKIKQVKAPNIPDTTQTSKTSVEDKGQIKKEQDDKKYREKIGFRKL